VSDTPSAQPPGWYHAQGDPPGTQRFWDGSQWQGGPQPVAPPPPGGAAGPGVVPAPGTAPASDLASPGQRIGARLIDWLLWVVITAVITLLFFDPDTAGGFGDNGDAWLAGLLTTLAVVAYEVGFVATKGATPGKLALGLRVARADTRVTPVDLSTAVVRVTPLLLNLIPVALLSLLVFAAAVASFFLLFADAQRQTVWDKLARTVVVRAA
jgi:uncharacterized RDD family membrane protein YckC